MDDDEPLEAQQATPELPIHFPRGGKGRPQPLPRGASVALIVISLGVLGMMGGMLAWLLM